MQTSPFHSVIHSLTHTHTHTCKKRIEYNRTHLHNKCDYVLTRNFSVIAANSYVRVQGSVPWLFMLHVWTKWPQRKVFFSEYFTFLLQKYLFFAFVHNCNNWTSTLSGTDKESHLRRQYEGNQFRIAATSGSTGHITNGLSLTPLITTIQSVPGGTCQTSGECSLR